MTDHFSLEWSVLLVFGAKILGAAGAECIFERGFTIRTGSMIEYAGYDVMSSAEKKICVSQTRNTDQYDTPPIVFANSIPSRAH
jgi:hypothetical protein